MRRPVLAAVLAASVFLAACGGGSSKAASTSTTTRKKATSTTSTTAATSSTAAAPGGVPDPGRVAWTACGRYKCGSIEVPMDYADPGGRKVRLALIMRPASVPSKRIGSLAVNPGGPGGSGIEMVQTGFTITEEIGNRFDLVGFDPRGVGKSTPVACDQDVPAFRALDSGPDDPTEQQQLDDAARKVADDCAKAAGDLLAHVDTETVAKDLESIRVALGEPTLSFAGFSYGTQIGQFWAEQFPKSVRALLLDGVVDPAASFEEFLAGQAAAQDRTMQQVFANCDQSPSCPVKGGEAAAYNRIAAQVERQRLPAGQHTLGPSELAVAAIDVTYVDSLWPVFHQGIAKALQGDGSTLWSLFHEYETLTEYGPYAAVVCTDSPHPEGSQAFAAFAERLGKVSPRWGEAVANEMLPCAYWAVPPTGKPHDVQAPGTPPVLVIGNTGDAATPYTSAVKVAKDLEGGHLLTFEAEGHTAAGRSACVDSWIERYFITLEVPPDGTRCKE